MFPPEHTQGQPRPRFTQTLDPRSREVGQGGTAGLEVMAHAL